MESPGDEHHKQAKACQDLKLPQFFWFGDIQQLCVLLDKETDGSGALKIESQPVKVFIVAVMQNHWNSQSDGQGVMNGHQDDNS